MEDSLACEVFEEAGTSDPEMEITACLAPQLSVGSWNLDSHFMEDLGADSEDLGRMISQARSDLSLQKIDLRMLSEHPTVRSLAVRSSLQSAKSDSEDEDKVTPGESNTLLDSSPRAAEQPSHATCLEVGQQSLSYLQLSGGFGTDFGADSLMGKTWDRGKTVSDKKFSRNIIDNSKVPTEPFYVATIAPVIHYCIGGLECTMEAKCVDRSGKPIPGPRMAGEATAGPHGSYRLGGNSLLGYVVFGRVAGQGLAAYMNFQVEQFPDVYAELSTSDMFSAGMTMAVAITAPWNYTLIRFFIGCAGATFVTNQFWRSPMFTPNVVGTANATAAGWGNLGGGVTQICRMSVIFNPMVEEGLETNVVWRVSMVVLAVMSVICAVCMKLLCWDMPIGKHYDPVITGKTHEPSMWDYVEALKDIVAANSCHCFVSVSMLLSAMFAVQDLPHECVHGWLQLCFEATCLTVFAFPYIHVGSMRDLMKWSMVVPFCCGMLLTSILALKTTPMSLVIVLRNTSPLITLLIARFYPEQLRSNTDVLVSILVMIMGGLMYVSQSSHENWQGIGWIFLSSGFAVVDRLLRRLSLPKNQHPVDISKTGATLINNYVGLLPVGLAAYMNFQVEQFPDVYAELSTSDMFYTGMTMAVAITAPWHYSLIGFFIGCAGATFITNQFWRSPMFAPNVVGAANALLPVGLAGYMNGEVEQFPAVYAKLSTLDKFYVGMAMATAITAPWNYTLIRFFTGCAGATFVTNQFWCSLMFALNVVGTAIDTAAGQATMPSLHASYSTRWVFSSSSTLPITTNRAELGPKSQHRGNKQCHLLFALLLLLTQITLAAGAVIDPGKPRVIIGPATMMGASTERSSSANTGEAKTCGKGLQRQRLAIQKIAFRRATARAQREGLTQPLLYCAKIE